MPLVWVGRSWWKKRSARQSQDERELEDGMTLSCYLLGAMVSTLLWVLALVLFVLRYN